MKKPTLISCLLVAALLSGLAYLSDIIIDSTMVGSASGVVVLLASVYCFLLMWHFKAKSGRAVMGVLLITAPVIVLIFSLNIIIVAVGAVGTIWVCRSLLGYKGVVPALIDGALCGGSLLIAAVCSVQSDSLTMGIWVFLLAQCLFVYIPAHIGKKSSATKAEVGGTEERFNKAYNTAQSAVERLLTEEV
ncbi:MAG: hypothetical protein JKY67_20330 [Pseudomonadales bacterium]|nr:hypothetical protein [Pseudomonadales bacterium]